MNKGYINVHFLRPLAIALMTVFMAGCTAEDMSKCGVTPGGYTPTRLKIVVPADAEGETRAAVSDVQLYVFDKHNVFIEDRLVRVNEEVELNYPQAGELKVVGIANCGTNEDFTHCTPDGHISGGVIELRGNEPYQDEDMITASLVCTPPSDIFHGIVTLANDGTKPEEGDVYELPVIRIVSQMNIRVKKLREFASAQPEDGFSVIVATQYRKVDFYGTPSGGDVVYRPNCYFESSRSWGFAATEPDFTVPAFNMISSDAGEDVVVKILHNGNIIERVSTYKDNNGQEQPLRAINGKMLNVLVDFDGNINVSVEVTDWNHTFVWKIYDND